MLSTNGKYNTNDMSSLTTGLCEPLTSFKCPSCRICFSDTESLRQHYKIHAARKSYFCKYCNKLCQRPSHLQMHEQTHTNEKPYPCEYCGTGIAERSDSVRHVRSCKVTKKNGAEDTRSEHMESSDNTKLLNNR